MVLWTVARSPQPPSSAHAASHHNVTKRTPSRTCAVLELPARREIVAFTGFRTARAGPQGCRAHADIAPVSPPRVIGPVGSRASVGASSFCLPLHAWDRRKAVVRDDIFPAGHALKALSAW